MTARDIPSLCISMHASVRDAITCIDRSGRISIALVVDDNRRILNTITDGDIRRGILAGMSLTSPISGLLALKAPTPHPKPVTAPVGTSPVKLLRLMQQQHVRQIPLVDDAKQVVDIVILSDLLAQDAMPMNAVIMAGGFGKRLSPLTDTLPKPMLSINGQPVMERIVQQLRESGIRQINITTHYKPEKIIEHFGDGQSFGVNINYVNEDRPLGTGGALGLMPKPTETQLVINGDILTQVDFQTMLIYHREHEADMTVAISQYCFQVPYGTLECEGVSVRTLREKPEMRFLINAGIYLLEPSVHQYIPKEQVFNMTDLIQKLLDSGRRVIGFPIFEQWLDIGQPADYQKAQLAARDHKKD